MITKMIRLKIYRISRNIIFILISFVLSISTLYSQDLSDDIKRTGKLTVTVSGFKNDRGQLRIAVFNSEKTYSAKKESRKPFIRGHTSIKNRKAIWVYENMPFGEYAIICYHDENGNSKMDKKFLGIPEESYGFSNNAKGSLGMPDYEKAKFILNTQTKNIEIRVE